MNSCSKELNVTPRQPVKSLILLITHNQPASYTYEYNAEMVVGNFGT